MKYHILGKTGQSVSSLGFGTMNLSQQDYQLSKEALNYALDEGVNYIDTASTYKNSEEIVGDSISHRRHEFFLATKTRKRTFQESKGEIEQSLRRLKTDYIDLLQIHYVNYVDEYRQVTGENGALEAVKQAQKEGKVRFIGITGHRPELLARWLKSGHFDTVLFHMSLVQPFALKDLVPYCEQNGIGMIGMKPLSGGFVQPIQKALRFSNSTPIHVVLSGMKTKEEVKENIDALKNPISQKEKKELWSLSQELGEHGCRRCNYCSCPLGIRIPDLMISHKTKEKLGLLTIGNNFYSDQSSKILQCSDYGPCKEKPLCQQDCPYHLPIKQTVVQESRNVFSKKF